MCTKHYLGIRNYNSELMIGYLRTELQSGNYGIESREARGDSREDNGVPARVRTSAWFAPAPVLRIN